MGMTFTPQWWSPGTSLKIGTIQIAKKGFADCISGKFMKAGTAFRFVRWGVPQDEYGKAELKNLNRFLADTGEQELPGEAESPDLFTEKHEPPPPLPCYSVPQGKEYQVVQGGIVIWTCRNQTEAIGAAKCLTAIGYRAS